MNIYKRKVIEDNFEARLEAIGKSNKPERARRLIEETDVLYLRKANQIHNYFVNTFVDGVDECQDIPVEIEDIKKLKNICKRVLDACELEVDYQVGGGGIISIEHDKKVLLVKKGKDEKTGDPCFLTDKWIKADDLKESDLWTDNEKDFLKGKTAKVVSIKKPSDEPITVRFQFVWVGKIVKNPQVAKKLLPTTSGFFFGSTDYDEMYLQDLESFVKQADNIIKEHKRDLKSGVKDWDISYVYRASW